MPTPLVEIEQRLARTQRSVLALAVLLLVVVAALGAQRLGPVGSLKTRAIEIVDEQGRIVALIGPREGRTGLFIMDEASVPRLSVFHADDADGLYIDDADGVTRIGIAQFAHGGGGIALHGPESKGAAVLYFKHRGSLRFYDETGKVVDELAPEGVD